MADCTKYQEMISAGIDGELTEEQQAELDAHLALCPDCAALADALQSLDALCVSEPADPPEILAAGIMTQISAAHTAKLGRSRHRVIRLIAGFAAAAACLALAFISLPRILPLAASSANDFAVMDSTRSPDGVFAEDDADACPEDCDDSLAETTMQDSAGAAADDAAEMTNGPKYAHTAEEFDCSTLIIIYGTLPFDARESDMEPVEIDGGTAYLITVASDLAQQLMDTDAYDFSVDRDAQTDRCIVLYYP